MYLILYTLYTIFTICTQCVYASHSQSVLCRLNRCSSGYGSSCLLVTSIQVADLSSSPSWDVMYSVRFVWLVYADLSSLSSSPSSSWEWCLQ